MVALNALELGHRRGWMMSTISTAALIWVPIGSFPPMGMAVEKGGNSIHGNSFIWIALRVNYLLRRSVNLGYLFRAKSVCP
jgi:hypothetical protein